MLHAQPSQTLTPSQGHSLFHSDSFLEQEAQNLEVQIFPDPDDFTPSYSAHGTTTSPMPLDAPIANSKSSNPSITEIRPACFMIDTLEKANWAAKRILEAQRRISDRLSLASEYRDRIDRWVESANSQDTASIDYFNFILRPWLTKQLETMGKRRSVTLPLATIGLRSRPDHLAITDEATALAHCETDYPEAVVVTKSLSKSILKNLLQTGHSIPGVYIEEGREDLTVKPTRSSSKSLAQELLNEPQ